MVANFWLLPLQKWAYSSVEFWPGGSQEGRWEGWGEQGLRSVNDAEWHSELLHSSQRVQSKQAAVPTLSLICCFPQPGLHWLYNKHTLPPQNHKKHSQFHVQYVLHPNEFPEKKKHLSWVRELFLFSFLLAHTNIHSIMCCCCYNIISTAVHSSH